MKKGKSLSKEDVLHLGKLSNLTLSEREVAKYQEQLGETLAYVENLKKLDISKVDPLHHVTNQKNVMFEDGEKDTRGLKKDEALKNSKSKKNGMFVVKRLIE